MRLLALALFLPAVAFAHVEAEVLRVVDGDTVRVRVAVVPGTYHELNIRIAGINAPETRSKKLCEVRAGWVATEQVERQLEDGDTITVDNIRLGTWAGRHVADIYVDGVSLAHHLLRCGLAIPYDGRGRRPEWPCRDWR